MKIPTTTNPPNLKDRISYIERTIARLGVCSINTGKLTLDEVAALREHFIVEQQMGFTKFTAQGHKGF